MSEGWDESVPAQGSDRDVFYRFMDDVFDEFDGLPGRYDIADAILARWRLVPVKQEHPAHDFKGAKGSECPCWGEGYLEGVDADVHG